MTRLSKYLSECGFASCLIYESGCVNPNSPTSKVKISAFPPFNIEIMQNVGDGWQETKCLVCLPTLGGIQVKLD